MRSFHLRFFLAVAVLAVCSGLALAQQQTPAEKTAEQEFKNIQVFKGKPANELRPTMSFIANSLGVRCSFCHAQPFSADTKPTKATARKMIEMVFAINKSTFNGREEVNCYTCHQGHTRPNSRLGLTAAAAEGGPGRGGAEPGAGATAAAKPVLPTAQQLFDKYVAAIGGAQAWAAVQSETITAERQAFGHSAPETVIRTSDKLAVTSGADSKSGYDGSQYWSWNKEGASTPASDAIANLRTDLGLYPGEGVKLERSRVSGPEAVGDRSAYVVMVRGAAGVDRYYFDTESGLLLRYDTGAPTFLGPLPLQVEFADYRAVDAVKVPFSITWSAPERKWQRQVSAVKLNAAVDAAAFQPPAAAAAKN
ncbi:MAG TPA: c-type cytochrome [Terriglobales bacterium]|nr:c-type cytochrome [Terriglobales bacterium]